MLHLLSGTAAISLTVELTLHVSWQTVNDEGARAVPSFVGCPVKAPGRVATVVCVIEMVPWNICPGVGVVVSLWWRLCRSLLATVLGGA